MIFSGRKANDLFSSLGFYQLNRGKVAGRDHVVGSVRSWANITVVILEKGIVTQDMSHDVSHVTIFEQAVLSVAAMVCTSSPRQIHRRLV